LSRLRWTPCASPRKFLPDFKGLKLNPCGTRAGYNCELAIPSRPVNILDLMTLGNGFEVAADGKRFLIKEAVKGEEAEKPAITLVLNWAADLKQ
jgi:hypothetical protein